MNRAMVAHLLIARTLAVLHLLGIAEQSYPYLGADLSPRPPRSGLPYAATAAVIGRLQGPASPLVLIQRAK
jgi:hypothetical protein